MSGGRPGDVQDQRWRFNPQRTRLAGPAPRGEGVRRDDGLGRVDHRAALAAARGCTPASTSVEVATSTFFATDRRHREVRACAGAASSSTSPLLAADRAEPGLVAGPRRADGRGRRWYWSSFSSVRPSPWSLGSPSSGRTQDLDGVALNVPWLAGGLLALLATGASSTAVLAGLVPSPPSPASPRRGARPCHLVVPPHRGGAHRSGWVTVRTTLILAVPVALAVWVVRLVVDRRPPGPDPLASAHRRRLPPHGRASRPRRRPVPLVRPRRRGGPPLRYHVDLDWTPSSCLNCLPPGEASPWGTPFVVVLASATAALFAADADERLVERLRGRLAALGMPSSSSPWPKYLWRWRPAGGRGPDPGRRLRLCAAPRLRAFRWPGPGRPARR